MCFKRNNHHDILLQLLEELKDLQSPTLRYWGGEENQVYPTMVFLEMISNDLSERCSNTCTTLNGTLLTDGDIHVCSMTILFPPANLVILKALNSFFLLQQLI
jgi:hypothetical protein